MRLHKMNEENENTDFSIIKVYKMVTEGLRDYINPSDLEDVLDDWEYTVDNDEERSEIDLPLTIPLKKPDSNIEFGFGKLSCEVPHDFSLANIDISLTRYKDHYALILNAPTLRDIVNSFCDEGDYFSNHDYISGDIDTESNTKKFITEAKKYLDLLTDGINTILVQLAKISSDYYPIWEILYDEKNRLK